MRVYFALIASLCGAAILGSWAGLVDQLDAQSETAPPTPIAPVQVDMTPGTISGRVLNSVTAAPVARVSLTLISSETGQTFAATDAAGAFSFPDVRPGDYTLEASRNNFLTMFYGAGSAQAAPAVLHLAPGQAMPLTFSLIPQSVLAVEVYDTQGEALQRATVQVFARRFVNGRLRPVIVNEGQTDDLGHYRAATLPAGSYFVAATPPNSAQPALPRPQGERADSIPGPTLYPSATSFASALPVKLGSGAETPVAITIAPGSVYRIRGTIPRNLVGAGGGSLILLAKTGAEPDLRTKTVANIFPDGRFELSGVAPGSYVLGFTGSPDGLAPRLLARADVALTESDATGIALEPVMLVTLTGRVTLDGEPFTTAPNRPSTLAISLASLEAFAGTPGERPIPLQPDGSFTVENLPQARYRVLPTFAIGSAYISAIRMGDSDITNLPIDLTTVAVPQPIEVQFKSGAVTLEVIVDRPQELDPGTVVVVPDPYIPAGLPLAANAPVILTPDQSGFAVARNLPPGTYRAYDFELFEPNAGIDPAALKAFESKSSSLKLTAGQGGRVAVPRISAAEAAALQLAPN